MHWTTTASAGSVRITRPARTASRSADRRDSGEGHTGGASLPEELDTGGAIPETVVPAVPGHPDPAQEPLRLRLADRA